MKVAEGARICGASKIIGVDINPDKHELGKPLCLYPETVLNFKPF